MFSHETATTQQSQSDTDSLHALWGREGVEQPCTLRVDGVLRMLLKRFCVDSVVITLRDKDGAVVKIRRGENPLETDYGSALAACADGDRNMCVLEDVDTADKTADITVAITAAITADKTADSAQKKIRFYAGAPLFIEPLGDPVGALSLMATQPKTFSDTDRSILKSAALAVSAMLVMPHNPAAAADLALSAQEGVVVISHDQAIEAVNQRVTQLTHLSPTDAQRLGVEQLLCLNKEHAGAVVLGHALLVEQAAHCRTRCRTKNGSTLPVHVLTFPLPDAHDRICKTILLIAPVFKGRLDDFLLSLRSAERDELLELHIAGLWAVDAAGRILKITGAPIAHMGQAALEHIAGKLLGSEGIFDVSKTNWRRFYNHVVTDNLPPDMECCVSFEGHQQWFGMKGFRQTDPSGNTVGFHGSFRDITDRKLRELALQKSEERLSLILKGTNDGAWDWDLESGHYYLSPRWWEMMGRVPDSAPFRDEIWMDFIHPDDRVSVRAALSIAIAAGRDNYQAEFRMQHLRGHYLTVLGRGHILYNRQGRAIRTSGTNIDLTQQRQAQSQIRLLQSCVESIEDVVLITHASRRSAPGPIIVYVNPAFETFTGYSSQEVIGKSPRLLQGALTSRRELNKISDALQQWRSVKVELANYKKNGELFWIELEVTPVQADGSDQFTHWIGVQRNITKRKIAELALRTSNDRLNMAMEASGLGFWTRYEARGDSFYDERWHAMLGHPPGYSSTKPDEWRALVHPDDLAIVKASETQAVLQLDATFEAEFRMRHRDGHWVWIQSRGKVIERDASGRPLVVAGTHLDVSVKVEARLLAERMNAPLSRCLEHLNVGVILQRHGVIKFVNSTLLTIFGGTKCEDIVGTKFSDYILPGDVQAAVWRQSQLYAGATLPSFWFNCVHLDGRVFKALTSSAVIEWEGEPHILSTMMPPGDIALLSEEMETSRRRYEVMLAKQIAAEQARLAHELHDSLGSQLTGIALHAAGIKLLAETGQPLVRETDQMLSQLKKATEMTRSLARGLAPVDAFPGAFWRALEKLCFDFSATKKVQCTFEIRGDFDAIPAETGTHLYRITQEAISNSVRHGGATCITVSLVATGEHSQMMLRIQDDGEGFDATALLEAHGQGIGLGSMYARAKAIEAQITLTRVTPKGFCVCVCWLGDNQQNVPAAV